MEKITKAIARERLADVPLEKQFWCTDGRAFKNLSELQAAFADMSEGVFLYHANETKNDFSAWVKDVFGDEKLAGDLMKSKTGTQAARAVADRIAWLRNKAKTG